MKISSVRSDIVVVGGGIGGICAAISAARKGLTVSLVEKNTGFGGKLDYPRRHPFDFPSSTPQIYKRETGLANELWEKLFKNNQEGTYVSQNRVFHDWLRQEKLIRFFLSTDVEEVTSEKRKILRIVGRNRRLNTSIAFLGKFFVDSSGSGILSELAGFAGDKGLDVNETLPFTGKTTVSGKQTTCGCLIKIEKSEQNSSFVCPEWVTIKWEENEITPRLNLLKSLDSNIQGYHLVEWQSATGENEKDPLHLALAAWDFLKNRSSVSNLMNNFKLVSISENVLPPHSYRAEGEIKLNLDDLVEANNLDDSVALGRSPISQNISLTFSEQNSFSLTRPFEIPLRSMLSKECKNLFLNGSSASSSELTSRSLGVPNVAAQMGTAIGTISYLCLSQNRLPKTLSKKGYIDQIRNELYKSNHIFSLKGFKDYDNLSLEAEANASSTLDDWGILEGSVERTIETNKCLIQFPVNSRQIEKLIANLLVSRGSSLSYKLLEGSGYNKSIAGMCLHTGKVNVLSDQNKVEFEFDVQIKERGWHFLEIVSEKEFRVPLFKDGAVGYILHNKKEKKLSSLTNNSDYLPIVTNSQRPSPAPKLEIFPKQSSFNPCNILNHTFCPDSHPGLWISKPTDFKYPEFVELEWNDEQDISRIDISFDPTYEFTFSEETKLEKSLNFHSLIKDYRIYSLDGQKKSKLIRTVSNNQLAFRSHVFEPFQASGIEIEILSTHGLNRAQIYQVRVYA